LNEPQDTLRVYGFARLEKRCEENGEFVAQEFSINRCQSQCSLLGHFSFVFTGRAAAFKILYGFVATSFDSISVCP
jgi:hypothetical protein